jgi:hypothetical protein
MAWKLGQIKMLIQNLKVGMTITDSCTIAGLNRTQFYNRMKDDAVLKEQVDKAILASKIRSVTLIQNAMRDNWTACAWWLERRFPEEYGNRLEMQHKGKIGLEAKYKDLSDDQIRTLIESRARKLLQQESKKIGTGKPAKDE